MLRLPEFRRLLYGALLHALGQWMERTAIGWFVFDLTGSVFLTALAWSARSFPNLLGPVTGAIADRYPRGRVLALSAAGRGAVVLVMALVIFSAGGSLLPLLALVALGGLTSSLQLASLQSLAAELAGPDKLASAVSLISFAQRGMAALGALSSGFLIAAAGAGYTVLLAGAAISLSALAFATVPSRPPAPTTQRLRADVLEGLQTVVRVPIVALLLGLMVCIEILGFSYDALLPAVAVGLLSAGPEGLGILVSAASVGSLAGTGLLVGIAERVRQGPFLLGVVAVFGVLLMLLSNSRSFELSAVLVAGIGAMAALVDALEWTLLQASVDERLRGRVLGAWNFAIAWGWIGPVVLGALGEVAGVAVALAVSGALLAVVGIIFALSSSRLRN